MVRDDKVFLMTDTIVPKMLEFTEGFFLLRQMVTYPKCIIRPDKKYRR